MFKISTLFLLVAFVACDTLAPPKYIPPPHPPDTIPQATTPEILMDNLASAMRNRDGELYEELLDTDFLFTELNCLGEVAYHYGLEEELEIMVGSRDDSQAGIFDKFRTFEYDFTYINRYIEYGSEHPKSYPDDPAGHPDEDWEVYYGRVQMLLLDDKGDGFRVDQNMTYKLRFDTDDNVWRIIHWINDPLGGAECAE